MTKPKQPSLSHSYRLGVLRDAYFVKAIEAGVPAEAYKDFADALAAARLLIVHGTRTFVAKSFEENLCKHLQHPEWLEGVRLATPEQKERAKRDLTEVLAALDEKADRYVELAAANEKKRQRILEQLRK